jgi:hypothetical protein
MGLELLTERYVAQIAGGLSCWDKALIFGTLPKICLAARITSYMIERRVRIFDYQHFAETFRDEPQEHVEPLATESGLEIDSNRKRNFRKKERVKETLARRGKHPGLMCVLSTMEPCSTYKLWHDKQTGRTFLKPDDGKCLQLLLLLRRRGTGLCQMRLPAWLPCRLQHGGRILSSRICRFERSVGLSLFQRSVAQILARWRSRVPDGSAGGGWFVHLDLPVAIYIGERLRYPAWPLDLDAVSHWAIA